MKKTIVTLMGITIMLNVMSCSMPSDPTSDLNTTTVTTNEETKNDSSNKTSDEKKDTEDKKNKETPNPTPTTPTVTPTNPSEPTNFTEEGNENGGNNEETPSEPNTPSTDTTKETTLKNVGDYNYIVKYNNVEYSIVKSESHTPMTNDFVYIDDGKTKIRIYCTFNDSVSLSLKVYYVDNTLTVKNYDANGKSVKNVEINNNTIIITM